jgi:uncharacterized membrane protein YhaH (DUF805 family)
MRSRGARMKNFFNFRGRAGRAEFWVIFWLVAMAMLVADFGIFTLTGERNGGWHWITTVLDVALLAPVAVRRQHDRNKSARGLLIALGSALASILIEPLTQGVSPAAWAPVVSFVLLAPAIGIFLRMGFSPGTAGENRFGPEPQPLAQPAV